MQVFADHCVPTDVVTTLRAVGIEVHRASEVGLDRAPDEQLFEYAKRRRMMLLTADRDFGNIIRFDIQRSFGVVILELESLSKAALLRRVREFFRHVRSRSLRGKLVLLDPTRERVWPRGKR